MVESSLTKQIFLGFSSYIIQCDGEILLLKATFNIIEVIFSNKRPIRPIEGSLVN
jgi:hypothetical protein